MLFKSKASFPRSSAVAKTLWQNTSQPVPGFFISTPQFKRQQSQVVPYKGESRHSGSNLHSQPHVVLSSGPNFSTTSVVQSLDDDRDEPLRVDLPETFDGFVVPEAAAAAAESARAAEVRTADAPEASGDAAQLEAAEADAEAVAEAVEADAADADAADAEVAVEAAEAEAEAQAAVEVADVAEVAEVQAADAVTEASEAISALQLQGNHSQVLDVFSELESSSSLIPLTVYNQLLTSLACLGLEAQDMSVLLQAYERLLSQGTVPTKETYAIVIGALVDMAEQLGCKRRALEPVIGPAGELEAVDDVYEQLAAADHVRLASAIFAASVSVDGANFSVAVADRLLAACVAQGVAVDAALAARVSPASVADQIAAADAAGAEALFAAAQASQDPAAAADAGRALVVRLVQLGESERAVKAYAKLDRPELLAPLLLAFARAGQTATALRWLRKSGYALPFAEQAELLAAMAAHASLDSLASAGLLYARLAALKDAAGPAFDGARCAFLRLAASLPGPEADAALQQAVKESHLRDASWDPVTTLAVVRSLLTRDSAQSALALDVFCWQATKLAAAWQRVQLRSFIGQDMLAAVDELLPALTVEQAVALARVPFLVASFGVLQRVAETLWAARAQNPRVLVEAGVAAQVLELHNKWILNAEGHLGLALPSEIVEQLRAVYPLIAADAGGGLEKCFELLGLEVPKPAAPRQLLTAEAAPHTAANEADLEVVTLSPREAAPLGEEDAARAIALAATPTLAVDRLEAALVRGTGHSAVVPLIDAADAEGLERLQTLAETYLSGEQHAVALAGARRALVQRADVAYTIAQRAHAALLAAGDAPCASGYAQLILGAPLGATPAVVLFNEARARGVAANTFLYNVVLARLARAKRFVECDTLFAEMAARGVPRSEVTYGTMISAACRAGRAELALTLFAEMEAAPGYVARVAPFNMLMQFFIHTRKDRVAALAMFDRLKHSAAEPSPYSYQLAMEAWLLAPCDIAAADELLLSLKRDNVPATTKHFATLLHARGVLQHDLSSAISFYQGLVKNSRVLPDRLVFKALLESYVVNNKTAETPRVLDEMNKYHVAVDSDMLDTLVRGWQSVDGKKAAEISQYL